MLGAPSLPTLSTCPKATFQLFCSKVSAEKDAQRHLLPLAAKLPGPQTSALRCSQSLQDPLWEQNHPSSEGGGAAQTAPTGNHPLEETGLVPTEGLRALVPKPCEGSNSSSLPSIGGAGDKFRVAKCSKNEKKTPPKGDAQLNLDFRQSAEFKFNPASYVRFSS